ncbi:M20 family metallopeptidase [Bacillus sp. T33-2]|uniref:M20 family metallopeptidase n=1 Tax=Bacillus sp. T33-2 TaxID=2054168 RepID=UPI0015E099B6|nr:M20 family metallopeptidase [Bacillus sp. T33-2]
MSIDSKSVSVLSFVDKNEVVQLTRELIKIKSVYRPGIEGGNEEKVARFVQQYLKDIGLEVNYQEVVPGRPNIIAILDSGQPGKTLLFEGHTDVVTEGNLQSWNYDPFGAVIENGRIYGRGACDTKGNLAAAITAVHTIKKSGVKFTGKILLCIPCDEEDMMIGIKDFIRQGWAKDVNGAIICEPEENQLCITQKGAIRAIIKTYGKMAHGAMPLTGINPITRMARLITELEKLEQSEKDRVGQDPYLGWPSITPTILHAPVKGDSQINVMPDTCMAALDIRTIPGQDHEMLKQSIEAILGMLSKNDPDFKASFEVIEDRPWTETDRNDPLVKAVDSAYREITGKEPIYNGVPGATDGTFLHLAGVPILTTGAGDRHIPHHANEYVDIDELVETVHLYTLSAIHFLS